MQQSIKITSNQSRSPTINDHHAAVNQDHQQSSLSAINKHSPIPYPMEPLYEVSVVQLYAD